MLVTGLVVVTGDSKGKTTNALGYALTALGLGKKVSMIQFQKGGGYSGELFVKEHFAGLFEIKQFGGGCPISEQIRSGELVCTKCGYCFRENKNPANDFARQALKYVWQNLQQRDPAVLILDEVSHAVNNGLIALTEVQEIIDFCQQTNKLLVLTGRRMPEPLIVQADIATECKMVKHPRRDQGIDARRGIEY